MLGPNDSDLSRDMEIEATAIMGLEKLSKIVERMKLKHFQIFFIILYKNIVGKRSYVAVED